jgi:hypothetical protein
MSGRLAAVTALAVGAIRGGRRALVRSTFDLAADFAQAEATGARRDFVQQLTRVDLLVLEDFGMKKLGPSAAEDLLEIFVRRHEAGSTLITTKSPDPGLGRVSRWRAGGHGHSRPLSRARNHCTNGRQQLSLANPRHCGAQVTRVVDAAGAMDAENAPTAPLLVMTLRADKRRRACARLGLTRYSQRLPLAGFQTFGDTLRSGRRRIHETTIERQDASAIHRLTPRRSWEDDRDDARTREQAHSARLR